MCFNCNAIVPGDHMPCGCLKAPWTRGLWSSEKNIEEGFSKAALDLEASFFSETVEYEYDVEYIMLSKQNMKTWLWHLSSQAGGLGQKLIVVYVTWT